MNPAIQPIKAASKEKVRLTRRELETSLRRIARAGAVIAASHSLIDRRNEMLDAAARILHNGHASGNAPLLHSTNSNSSA
jgi:hypothetical protein